MSFGHILYKIKINSNKFLKSYADLSEPVWIPLSMMLTKEAANNSKRHWQRNPDGFWLLCVTFKKFVGVEYFFVTFFYKFYSKEQLLNTEKTPLTYIIFLPFSVSLFCFTFSLPFSFFFSLLLIITILLFSPISTLLPLHFSSNLTLLQRQPVLFKCPCFLGLP